MAQSQVATARRRTANAVYTLNYHLVWCTKYRHPVLTGGIDEVLKQLLSRIAAERGYTILALEVMPDHVHLFISAPPMVAPAAIAKHLKGASAHYLFQKLPQLTRTHWSGHLWSPSYYVGSAGEVSAETIQRYIAMQKGR